LPTINVPWILTTSSDDEFRKITAQHWLIWSVGTIASAICDTELYQAPDIVIERMTKAHVTEERLTILTLFIFTKACDYYLGCRASRCILVWSIGIVAAIVDSPDAMKHLNIGEERAINVDVSKVLNQPTSVNVQSWRFLSSNVISVDMEPSARLIIQIIPFFFTCRADHSQVSDMKCGFSTTQLVE
jgi:hypothetical protein